MENSIFDSALCVLDEDNIKRDENIENRILSQINYYIKKYMNNGEVTYCSSKATKNEYKNNNNYDEILLYIEVRVDSGFNNVEFIFLYNTGDIVALYEVSPIEKKYIGSIKLIKEIRNV